MAGKDGDFGREIRRRINNRKESNIKRKSLYIRHIHTALTSRESMQMDTHTKRHSYQ